MDFEDEDDEHLEDNFALNVPDEEEPVLAPKIDSVIKKACAIVNIFNRGPQKNEILQRYVVLEHKRADTFERLQILLELDAEYN